MKKNIHFPQPSGSFKIGKMHLNFVDEQRIDPFPLAAGKNRDVPIMIWYPADKIGKSTPSQYIKQADNVNLSTFNLGFKLMFSKLWKIQTNSYERIPISTKEDNFPVILFNHGFTSFMEQNTSQMEHLASHGYIVVSISHPYDGVASYPDGRSIPMDNSKMENITKEKRKKMKDDYKQRKKLLKKLQETDLPFEELKELTQKFLHSDDEGTMEVWVDDVIFILNQLELLNNGKIKSIFRGKLDIARGVGGFGHSYGGATSILTSCIDDRITCGINMDGAIWPGFKEKFVYKKPYMFMENGESRGVNRYFYEVNQHDSYMVCIEDALHFDFSDTSLFGKSWLMKRTKIVGKIHHKRMQKIMNGLVTAFFDRYIKKIEAPLLDQDTYEGIVIEKRFSGVN